MIFFAYVCEFLWTTVKWCFRKVFFNIIGFGYKNVKINFLEEKSIFSAGFITDRSKAVFLMWSLLAVLASDFR